MRMAQLWIVIIMAILIQAGCSSSSSDSTESLAKINTSNGLQGSSAGYADVNGDGIDDMVVCAPYAAKGNSIGVAFIYLGSREGFEAKPYLVLSGGDNFGFSFVRLEDVDGDSIADFAISALHDSGDDVSLSGSVTIFKGGGNGTVIRKLVGEAALDRFGYTLAKGDLNGDGTSELIVGAPFHSPSPALYQQGAIYLYDFKSQTMTSVKASTTVQGIGWTVAGGNINGDAFDDLLVSSQTSYGIGNKVFVYSGRTDLLVDPGTPDRTFLSMASSFGDSLQVIQDLNSDGYNELLVGASRAKAGGMTEAGSLFVINGGVQNGLVNLDSTPAALLQKLDGQGAYDRFGSPAIAIGDIDGLGKQDIAVAATHADSDSFLMTGKVYVLKGEDLATETASIPAATVLKATGKDMHFGKSMAAFVKNGPKLLVGAPTAYGNAGAVFQFDPAVDGQFFQLSYGGITTVNETCCKR